jgi:hypothetical protein
MKRCQYFLTGTGHEAAISAGKWPRGDSVAAIETTGSGLIAALEQTWADIRRRTPQLPEVVVLTGTSLSPSAVHLDAKWGHVGADHWVEGRPTEHGQGAALDRSAARRKPELFVAGECLAEGPRQTLQTMLHEAVHALAHVRGRQPPRSFWIRARQYTPGPITCGICGQDFQP